MSRNNTNNSIFRYPKLRIIIFMVMLPVLIVLGVVVWHHYNHRSELAGKASVSGAPGIISVPGAGNPSNQYVKTQVRQNQEEIDKVYQKGGSAVPTITRANFIGDVTGLEPAKQKAASSHPRCWIKGFRPNPNACTQKNLMAARNAGVLASELRCEGCTCPTLKLVGYTAGDLKAAGFSARSLRGCGYKLSELFAAGFNARDLRAAGFSAAQLKEAGLSAAQLRAAGLSAAQLRTAGFSAAQLKEAGLSAAQLKAAGFSAAQLRTAGFSAKQLKEAGWSQAQLRAAGLSAAQLRTAGFSAAQLKEAGWSQAQIDDADKKNAVQANCSVGHLKEEMKQGISATAIKQKGCSIAQMKASGFSAAQLKAAGFSAAQLKAAGFSAAQLKEAGLSAKQLKEAGFSAAQLRTAGFSAKQLKEAGWSAKQLKEAGWSAKQLKEAGWSAKQLKEAGFSAGRLKASGLSAAQLKEAGFSARQLRWAGFSATELKNAGFSPLALKAGGFTQGDLLRAGFSPKESGIGSSTTISSNMCSLSELQKRRLYGISAKTLAAQGCSLSALKAAGFDALQLKNAGFSVGQLKEAGFSTNTLKALDVMPDKLSDLSQPNALSSILSNTPQGRLAQIQAAQARQISEQERENMRQQIFAQMTAQAQQLINGWSQSSHLQSVEGVHPEPGATHRKNAHGVGTSSQSKNQGPVIKAGTIMFAVLTTGINSDEQSPIMATIVDGPLKGSHLMGQFTRLNDKLMLTFNLLNMVSLIHSLSINAVAIDANTAHTAVSGNVNYHYLLRYGSLFASSFLQGFAQAQASGQTFCLSSSFCLMAQNKLTPRQQLVVALGNVGEKYADVMAQNFTTPPTVRIPGGTGIGVLLMSDLTVPLPKPITPFQKIESMDGAGVLE